MGKSLCREIYFQKHIRTAPDHLSYIEALEKSPYTQHKSVAKQLRGMVDKIEIEALRKNILQKAGNALADTEHLQISGTDNPSKNDTGLIQPKKSSGGSPLRNTRDSA